MSSHIEETIAEFQQDIRIKEREAADLKRLVNVLCERAGLQPIYGDADLKPSVDLSAIRADTFYGQPLNSSIRRVLEMRKAARLGAATVKEIYDALERGGYHFGASNRPNAVRGLRISLGKSTHTFHKLPNGTFGLLGWYPEARDSKATAAIPASDNESIEAGEQPADGEDASPGKEVMP